MRLFIFVFEANKPVLPGEFRFNKTCRANSFEDAYLKLLHSYGKTYLEENTIVNVIFDLKKYEKN